VTNAQYTEFLNAKASAADPYGLWNSSMDPAVYLEGAISRFGTGPYIYSVKPGYANKPVVYVSWYDAVRFVNWLTNDQGNGDTESGTYTITGGGNNSGTVGIPDTSQRAAWAASTSLHWLLPSSDEWYKAAYYNAPVRGYYFYPFQSDSTPAALAPPGNANSGNFWDSQTSRSAAYNYDGSGSYYSDVGAYPNSASPFGALDMGGNVYQWSDTTGSGLFSISGTDYLDDPGFSQAHFFSFQIPDGGPNTGFRVASIGAVPEPSTGLLAVLACGVIWCSRRRFKLWASDSQSEAVDRCSFRATDRS
jgi:sulfatase modifying factor 1